MASFRKRIAASAAALGMAVGATGCHQDPKTEIDRLNDAIAHDNVRLENLERFASKCMSPCDPSRFVASIHSLEARQKARREELARLAGPKFDLKAVPH